MQRLDINIAFCEVVKNEWEWKFCVYPVYNVVEDQANSNNENRPDVQFLGKFLLLPNAENGYLHCDGHQNQHVYEYVEVQHGVVGYHGQLARCRQLEGHRGQQDGQNDCQAVLDLCRQQVSRKDTHHTHREREREGGGSEGS